MAQPVTTQIQIGEVAVTGFTNLVISQSLFAHHHFSLDIPYDVVEGSNGGFLSAAHRQLCGQRLTIEIEPTPVKTAGGRNAPSDPASHFRFRGIVTQLQVGPQSDLTGSFQLQGYSPTYLLDQALVRRTFSGQTLPAIFRQVLQAYGDDVPPLQAQPLHTTPLPYVVQYDESDFIFLHRLAAQYGEWFFYNGTQLYLGRPTSPELAFDSDGVRSALTLTLALRHSGFVVSQYNLAQHQLLHARSQDQHVSWLGQNPLAQFALDKSENLFTQAMQLPTGIAAATQSEVNEVAARYKSQHATSLVSGRGWGENPAMRLGGQLVVSGTGLGTETKQMESFGKYLLTALTHHVNEASMYHNLFEAVPWSANHPPLGPPRQSPTGVPELAEVIDHQDPARLGRVRVRYYWPVARPQAAESNWLRISTPYSGDGKGQLFTPEIGSQVLIGYEHNRAEQPLVLGNLFHPFNPQEARYTTPNNDLKGWQTAGGNKVVMLDTAGQQTILISNSNNKDTAVTLSFAGDGNITIKSEGPVTVLSPTITLEAGKEGDIRLHAKNITLEAEGNMALSARNKTITTRGKLQISSGGNVDISGAQVKIND